MWLACSTRSEGAANFRPINIDQALNREFVCGKQAKRTDRLPCAGLWIQFILDLSRFKVVRPNPTRFFGLNPFLGWKNGLSRVELSPQVPNSGWNGGGLRFFMRTYFRVEPASTRQPEIEKKARIWKVESIKSTFLVWRCKNRSGRVVESIHYHQFCEQYISGSCCQHTPWKGKVQQQFTVYNWWNLSIKPEVSILEEHTI